MPELFDFSDEILLQIFPNRPLKSIIAARGVCKLWRRLVPHSDIDAVRRKLLNLYYEIIESPAFRQSRTWTEDNLQPFDRQAYIDALLDQHDYLPDDFRIWILEWPAKAVIACCWPGLPYKFWGRNETDDIEQIHGCNFLGRIPPIVHTVKIRQIGRMEGPVEVDVPAILVWQADFMVWLVLEQRPTCSHAVYVLEADSYDGQGEYGDTYAPDSEAEASESGGAGTLESSDDESDGQGEYGDTYAPDSEAEASESGGAGTLESSDGESDHGEYTYHGVFSSWTHWLKCAMEAVEYAVDDAIENPGTLSDRKEGPDYRLNGVIVPADEWFRTRPRVDRVWADSHDTGRRSRST
ncbi:hypothetical protein C8R46DRAFT_997180 [Mycena filopes]|nr:hypothetical protein C8R46DRAFT_997180 [Mycena filopes]